MLDEMIGQVIVVDLRSPYVCLGVLASYNEQFLEMHKADFHDLRDTETTRENYIAEAVKSGIKRNRRRVLVARSDVVALSRFEDVSFR